MKKFLLLFTLTGSFIGCSSDDDNSTTKGELFLDTSTKYKFVAIMQSCDPESSEGQDTRVQYCVTDSAYNNVNVNTPCTQVTFKDVDGVQRTGFFAGKGSGAGCYRKK